MGCASNAKRGAETMGLLALILNSAGIALAQIMHHNGGQQQSPVWQQDYDYGAQQQQSADAFANAFPYHQYGQWAQQAGGGFHQPHPPPPHHQLPYAGYRNSAFAPPSPTDGIDLVQRDRLAQIADESESFGSERARSGGMFFNNRREGGTPSLGGGDGIQRILATFAEKLPKIAETMASLGGRNAQPGSVSPNERTLGPPASNGLSLSRLEYGQQQRTLENNNSGSGSSLIDSMPEPSTLMSFNKLLSSFGMGGGSTEKGEVKGTPILKSEDLEPELVHKGVKDELLREGKFAPNYGQHLTPPPQAPASSQNPLNSLLQQFGISNFMQATTGAPPPQSEAEQAKRQQEEESGDLFGSLMKGKMPQMPDWLRSFGFESMLGGANGTKAAGGEDPGNALAQLFGGKGSNGGKGGFGLSSVLGSGLDDSPIH